MYRISEFSDVFADVCIRNEVGQLVFLSLFGRDGAIRQLMAAFHLPETEGGLEVFNLVDEETHRRERVVVGDSSKLEQFSGRLPKENLFGNIVQSWIYVPAIKKPSRAGGTAWILQPREEGSIRIVQDRIWQLYKLLSPLPLLDQWRDVVMHHTQDRICHNMELSDYPPLGKMHAVRIELPAKLHPHCSPNCIPHCSVLAQGNAHRFHLYYSPIASGCSQVACGCSAIAS